MDSNERNCIRSPLTQIEFAEFEIARMIRRRLTKRIDYLVRGKTNTLLEDGNNILPGTEDLSCEGAVILTLHSGMHPTQRGQVEEWPLNRIDCGEAGSLESTQETWNRTDNSCRGS